MYYLQKKEKIDFLAEHKLRRQTRGLKRMRKISFIGRIRKNWKRFYPIRIISRSFKRKSRLHRMGMRRGNNTDYLLKKNA